MHDSGSISDSGTTSHSDSGASSHGDSGASWHSSHTSHIGHEAGGFSADPYYNPGYFSGPEDPNYYAGRGRARGRLSPANALVLLAVLVFVILQIVFNIL